MTAAAQQRLEAVMVEERTTTENLRIVKSEIKVLADRHNKTERAQLHDLEAQLSSAESAISKAKTLKSKRTLISGGFSIDRKRCNSSV
jgi:phosphopantothenoylcysteine synthetase/decarboxylase